MMRLLFLLVLLFSAETAFACTNLLVTKGASADGSVMITYTADSAGFCPHLAVFPAVEYPPDAVIEVPATKDRPGGKIKQVPKTYHVIGTTWGDGHGNEFQRQGSINEFQLAIAETTFGGREELHNPQGLITYPMLITFALERSKTAREAVQTMIDLVTEYSYCDEGESISIGDKNEAWVFEIVGTGRNGKGAIWVARQVPDGEISAHANQARIGEIPEKPQPNFFYSENIISYAVEKGWYKKDEGKPFRFDEAYGDVDAKSKRVCETRTWSIFRRAAPSQEFSPDYHRGVEGAKPYPWSIKPDKKLTVADVMGLMRDHYNGTEYDMTRGIDAGEYGLPRRWRPLYWKLEADKEKKDAPEYAWERPISTQQTGYSVVSQSRTDLSDKVGGILWYGVDDSYLTCYFPLYCGITEVPRPFTVGSVKQFSWDSAWWIFNVAANYANLKYSRIAPEIITVQKELEENFLAMQKPVEKTATELLQSDPKLAQQFLTDYSVAQGQRVFTRWKQLTEHIFTKFNDGYIQNDDGSIPRDGDPYPDEWLQRVLKERPEQFKLPAKKN